MNLFLRLIISFTLSLAAVSANRRRRRHLQIGFKPDPPLAASTNSSNIYVSYNDFIHSFSSCQGLFNRTARLPSNSTYATMINVAAEEGTIEDLNEFAAFMAHVLYSSKGLGRAEFPEEDETGGEGSMKLVVSGLTRSYHRRGYLGIQGKSAYQEASLALFNDFRLLDLPELILLDEELNWKVALWLWKRHGHPALYAQHRLGDATNHLASRYCINSSSSSSIFKIYCILKQRWTPDEDAFRNEGCANNVGPTNF